MLEMLQRLENEDVAHEEEEELDSDDDEDLSSRLRGM